MNMVQNFEKFDLLTNFKRNYNIYILKILE